MGKITQWEQSVSLVCLRWIEQLNTGAIPYVGLWKQVFIGSYQRKTVQRVCVFCTMNVELLLVLLGLVFMDTGTMQVTTVSKYYPKSGFFFVHFFYFTHKQKWNFATLTETDV